MTSPLEMDVKYLPGGGPARGDLLARLEIHTVQDLLWYLPRDVLDLTQVRLPNELEPNIVQTVSGTIVDVDARTTANNKTMTACLLDCVQGYVRGVWWNQPWMIHKLPYGARVLFSGKPKKNTQGRWEFSNPRLQYLSDDEEASAGGGIVPRYRLTEGLRLGDIHRLMRSALEIAADAVPEHLPEGFLRKLGLPVLPAAIRMIHTPKTLEDYQLGRKRILFDDLLEFQTGVALRRRAWRARRGAPVIEISAKVDARIRRLFPFTFTPGQEGAIKEIEADLKSGFAMHRLLQADVGAGKTVVAIYTMLAAVAQGYQAVLMAPTELLAMQHWQTIENALSQSRVHRALLTGSLSAADRRRTIEGINQGEIQLVVGTQAVIQEAVQFQKLGVAVIDEQHKFGVAQRARFSNDGASPPPHVLVMTATPIPRSLCLTQFGDLDLTVVKDRPAGRQRVITSRISGAGARNRAWDFLRQQIRSGRQLYVVCPRVSAEEDQSTGDDTETSSTSNGATQVFTELQRSELKGFRLGLVHGQMNRDERRQVMDEFREGEIDVLVSTTVIEVGVDVPNATLMVIIDAENFGLSQLHQLRGRIARGQFKGYCFLFSEANAPESTTRLAALERTEDGFQISETDFELRGPGDVLGTRQHGAMPLKVADLVRDRELVEEVRDIAFLLVRSEEIDTPEFAPLKLRVLDRFADLMDLPRSG